MRPTYSVLIATALVAAAALAPAQRLASYGSGGFGLNSAYARLWNASTVTTFRGKISGITVASPLNGTGNSVRIVVRSTNGGSSLVELGPQWYVDRQNVKLKLKDNVTVTGSKIMLDGRGSFMASKVVVGRKTLVLRDARGNPYWAADSPAFAPAVVEDTPRPSVTTGTASQPITNVPAAPVVRVPVVPVNAARAIFTSPATVNGVIDSITVDEVGDAYMVLNLGMNDARTVYLGPAWYIERQDIFLRQGTVVNATLLAPVNGGVAYAQSVTAEGKTLYLRNNTGQTVWAPWFTPVG